MLEFVWKTDDWCSKSWERDLQSGRDHEGSLKMIRQYIMSSVQFSHSVMSKSLWPHELQHTRPPCSSPALGAYSNSCPSSQWCHPTISFSVVPFSSHLQSFPASESFQMSQFFASVGQSWGFSFSIRPSNEYSGLISFRMDCLDLFAVQGTLKSLLQHHSSKASILWRSAFLIAQLSHPSFWCRIHIFATLLSRECCELCAPGLLKLWGLSLWPVGTVTSPCPAWVLGRVTIYPLQCPFPWPWVLSSPSCGGQWYGRLQGNPLSISDFSPTVCPFSPIFCPPNLGPSNFSAIS